jgi:hypothetical protein
MPILHTSLSLVLEKFPHHGDKIKHLFTENSSFKSQCEDYLQCFKALKYWNHSASREAPARREEYGTLFQDLADEIVQTLDESK